MSAATGALDQARSGAVPSDLPLTLLAAGYHLRQINAVRARFDGRAERVALPVLLWLAARLADPDPEVAHAAAVVLQSLALETRPISRSYSLREIGDATGFPRETLRRTARQLTGFGWILQDTAGQLSVTPRFTDYLWADGESERLQDFRWTAARLRELSDPATASSGASVTEALAAMSACRSEELPRSVHWAIPATLAGAPLAAAMVYLCGYNLRHLLHIALHVDGDLLQVVLLGELAHRNIAALAPGAATRSAELAAVLQVDQPRAALLTNPQRAFNAYSLASCLGVPYETTRRKLTQLCTRGWVARDARGLYWVLPHAADYFQQFNLDRRANMLATAAMIEALLQSPAPSQTGQA
jgi:DNA-binding IclR family transcriptional regulator